MVDHRLPRWDGPAGAYLNLVATRVVEQRLGFGWSQRQLAARVGVSQKIISDWENAWAMPRVNHQLALAEAFGLHPDVLFRWWPHPGEPDPMEAP